MTGNKKQNFVQDRKSAETKKLSPGRGLVTLKRRRFSLTKEKNKTNAEAALVRTNRKSNALMGSTPLEITSTPTHLKFLQPQTSLKTKSALTMRPRNLDEPLLTGFTIVELLTSVGLFMIVIVATTGLFLSVVQGNRKAVAIQNILDEGKFVLEIMSRDIRTGRGFSAPTSNSIQFMNSDSTPTIVCYRYQGNPSYIIEKVINPAPGCTGTGDQVTSSHTRVDYLNFLVQGITLGDTAQPRVTIAVGISNKGSRPDSESAIRLQTTVSPRELDIN